jgi:hypothetical protein
MPAGRRPVRLRADGREVAIVAQADKRAADGRVGQPAGPPGRGQRHADRFGQAVAEQEQAASGAVHRAELGVRAEPARLPVQCAEHLVGGGAGRLEVPRRPDHNPGAGAQGGALGGGDGIVSGRHRPPRRRGGWAGHASHGRHQSSPRAGTVLVTTVLPLTTRVVVVTPEALVVATE